jgi:hypothetical protein
MNTLRSSDTRAKLDIPTGTCSVCGAGFVKFNSMQQVCGVSCARRVPIIARNTLKAQAKAEKAETKRRKEAAKPRKEWLSDAQDEVNRYARIRDKALGYGCISCGTKTGKENGGHFLSVGARPELRLEPVNIRLQCERCNTYLHGNLLMYRKNLIEREGLELVEWLEGPHEPMHYTIEELKAIKTKYRAMSRAIEKEN